MSHPPCILVFCRECRRFIAREALHDLHCEIDEPYRRQRDLNRRKFQIQLKKVESTT